jgi:cytochrome c-type biogenesis protein CcmH
MRIVLSLILLFSPSLWASPIYSFESPKQESQFNHLLHELRCLVCHNQDLADSNAELAKDLKQRVYELVLDGKSDSEISNFLAMRYGDFILFKPPVKETTYLLWLGPFIFLILGLFIFWRTCLKQYD